MEERRRCLEIKAKRESRQLLTLSRIVIGCRALLGSMSGIMHADPEVRAPCASTSNGCAFSVVTHAWKMRGQEAILVRWPA